MAEEIPARPKRQRSSPLALGRVVVVDDSRESRKRISEALARAGFETVGEAANGLDAWELTEKLQPDAVVIDLIMPEMHGIEAIGCMKKAGSKSRMVLVSSMADRQKLASLEFHGQRPDAIFLKDTDLLAIGEHLKTWMGQQNSQPPAPPRSREGSQT